MNKPFAASVALLFVAAALAAANVEKADDSFEKLRKYYKDYKYFELHDALARMDDDASPALDFFRGAEANAFNRMDAAAVHLVRYLEGDSSGAPRPLVKEAWSLLADTYRRSGQYAKAAATHRSILERYGEELDDSEQADYENAVAIWSALAEVPPQTIEIRGDSDLRMENRCFPIRIGDRILHVSFDTGSSLSVLYESAAKELGLALLGTGMKIQAGTGKQIESRMAVVPEMRLGEAIVRNAVFLVLPDALFPVRLARPGVERRGLLGGPVFTALREFSETRDGRLIIPAAPRPRSGRNMFFNGFKPVVEILHRGERLNMCLDSGSSATYLYPPYFHRWKTEIQARSKPRQVQMGGVGGERTVDIYVLDEFAFRMGDRDLVMKEIRVHTQVTHSDTEIFSGTLGRDILALGTRMTFNFESMSFVLE